MQEPKNGAEQGEKVYAALPGDKPLLVRLAEDFAEDCVNARYVKTSTASHARLMEEALRATPAPAAVAVPDGFALVPKRLTREMDEVLAQEGWQWEGLLAAAEAITETEHAALAAAPQAPAAPAEPPQIFESPRGKTLMLAFQEGWARCRDAEFVGEEAENDAFNNSSTLSHCIAEDMLYQPAAPAALPLAAYLCVEESGVIDFEVIPPCTLPPGEYDLYAKSRTTQAAQQTQGGSDD